ARRPTGHTGAVPAGAGSDARGARGGRLPPPPATGARTGPGGLRADRAGRGRHPAAVGTPPAPAAGPPAARRDARPGRRGARHPVAAMGARRPRRSRPGVGPGRWVGRGARGPARRLTSTLDTSRHVKHACLCQAHLSSRGERVRNDVRELRLAAGLSQAALAEALRVSRQTVNSIETGRYDPSLPLAIAIARHFNRTV